MLTPAEVDHWAEQLALSRVRREVREPISATTPFTLDDAYAIQRAVTARRVARGERIIGWKLGYTSLAMREQMGIDRPNFGPLTDAMLLASGADVGSSLIQPRVEPEIGLRFGHELRGAVDMTEVLAAISDVVACLEVVDSAYRGYRFRIEDNTADGSSAARVIVGPSLVGPGDLDRVVVQLVRNGVDVARATGAAAGGHPAAGVVSLVEHLALIGASIRPGDLVITGGLTGAVPLEVGDEVTALFDGSVTVVVRHAAAP